MRAASILFAAVVFLAGSQLFAQAPQSVATLTDEQQALEMVEKLRYLVRSQQKAQLKKLIEQHPNTRLATIAREILAELALYDAIADQEFVAKEAEKAVIRAYWDARRRAAPVVPYNPIVITNRSDETQLYQVKWRGVEWLGPYHIAPGQSHEFTDPLVFRRVTREGAVEYSLTPGQKYVFLRPRADATTSLYRE